MSELSHENDKITVRTWFKTIKMNYPSMFLDIKTSYEKSGFQLRDFTSSKVKPVQANSKKNSKKKRKKSKNKIKF